MVTSFENRSAIGKYVHTIPERMALSALRQFRPFIAEKIQVSGLENMKDKDGVALEGPFIWAVKHESRWDVSTLAHLWYKLPQSPCKMKAGVRFDPFKEHPRLQFLDTPLMWAFQKLAMPLRRTDRLEGLDDEQKSHLQNLNRMALDSLVNDFTKGVHGAFAPEGTSKSNGDLTQNPIKGGVYYLTRNAYDRGLTISIAPVGVTYDFMSGSKGIWGNRQGWGQPRQIVCARFGSPIKYVPLDKRVYEDKKRFNDEHDDEWRRNDTLTFLEQIKDAFIDLNTITLSQIAGEYIRQRVGQKVQGNSNDDLNISLEQIGEVVKNAVYNLQEIDDVCFEQGLINDMIELRLQQFYSSLKREGYVKSKGAGSVEIDSRRMLTEPDNAAQYKHENVFLYSTNRIRGIASVRPKIHDALEKTFKRKLKDYTFF